MRFLQVTRTEFIDRLELLFDELGVGLFGLHHGEVFGALWARVIT